MNNRVSIKILLLLSVLFTSIVDAQSVEAKQQLKNKLAELKSYQANFNQTVTDIEDTVLQQATGQIVLQQPNKLYWELLEPNESVLLADGTSIWNIDPFLEQVVVYSADSALQNNPLILLTDPDSEKWHEYSVQQNGSEFFIIPKNANGGIARLALLFEGHQLVKLESTDAQQQTSVLTFSKIEQNLPLPSSTFVFALPDGYELDDQRDL